MTSESTKLLIARVKASLQSRRWATNVRVPLKDVDALISALEARDRRVEHLGWERDAIQIEIGKRDRRIADLEAGLRRIRSVSVLSPHAECIARDLLAGRAAGVADD